jgi:ribulose 1,5-bisphosphate carboxylase large subunit-like protein
VALRRVDLEKPVQQLTVPTVQPGTHGQTTKVTDQFPLLVKPQPWGRSNPTMALPSGGSTAPPHNPHVVVMIARAADQRSVRSR